MNVGTPHTCDVAVVGNGVIGLSTARALVLQEANCRVVVVGPRQRAGAASMAAGGMLGVFGEVTTLTVESPPWRQKLEIGRGATALWPEWRASLNEDASGEVYLPTHSGTHVITNARSGASEDDNFAAIRTLCQEYEEPCEEVDPRTIPGLDPMAGARAFRALFLPNEGWQSSSSLVQALEVANARRGIQTVDETVVQVDKIGSSFRLTTSDGTTIDAAQVVLAAGTATQQLLDSCFPDISRRVPHVVAGVGNSLILSHPRPIFETVVRTPNRAGACGLHAVPYPEGTYLGAANHLQVQAEHKPRVRFLTHLLRTGIEQLNGALDECFLDRVQTGNRPVSLDGLPLVGATSVAGLWLLTGTYRDGFHDSPLLCRSLASELFGGERLVSPLFRPERAPIAVLPARQVADVAAHALVDVYSEFGFGLIPLLTELTHSGIHALTNRTLDQLGADVGLHPDVFIMLTFNPDELARVRQWAAQSDVETAPVEN